MTRPKPMKPPRVAGERVDLLVEALRTVDIRPEPGGKVRIRLDPVPTAGIPLARAVMRVEAELLLADARLYGTDAYQDRTSEDRRLEALLTIMRRLSRV